MSNGKYQESFPNDTTFRFGSVMFNRVTGEVVTVIEDDTLYGEYNMEYEMLRKFGVARVASFALVIALNANQYQSKRSWAKIHRHLKIAAIVLSKTSVGVMPCILSKN